MDEGELSMDQAHELTAEYICENEEWLKIALQVYEVKDSVRSYLARQIWQGVEKRIGDIDGIANGNSFSFPAAVEGFWIYAEVEQRWGENLHLIVGIYLDDDFETLDFARRQEIRQCYDAAFNAQCDSKGHYLVKADVGHDRELHRWDSDMFLRQAINKRDEVESYLADLLLETYRGIKGDLERLSKDV